MGHWESGKVKRKLPSHIEPLALLSDDTSVARGFGEIELKNENLLYKLLLAYGNPSSLLKDLFLND